MQQPNIIKVCVTAAGGRPVVAKALGESVWSITHWQRTGRVPAEKVRPLAALSRGVVSADDLLAYIEQVATREQAAA